MHGANRRITAQYLIYLLPDSATKRSRPQGATIFEVACSVLRNLSVVMVNGTCNVIPQLVKHYVVFKFVSITNLMNNSFIL
jgi:hypothetical protein